MLKVLAILIPALYISAIWFQSSYSIDEIISFLTSRIDRVVLIEEPTLPVILLGTLFELLHLIEFGILFFLMTLSLQLFGLSWKRAFPIAILTAAGYSVIDEWHQLHVPGRSASWVDLVKDWAGIVLVWYLMKRYDRNKKKRRRPEWSRKIGRRA
ncbi:VanZ family protein [Metabacillus sp. KIGAM252]|uniref:VanZ family protein n=1 Tax=Metabacillus flavus TaxID=2823519 RepID=A0ABS5LFU6_9BACI|nr:VanZ family protein [Metabacillus flavus]MBS2969631.1 VanZ family protein [Metabacillus flavus]